MAISKADLVTLSRLLDAGLALAPGERRAWLSALPAEHAPLLERLRDMLAAADAGDSDSGPDTSGRRPLPKPLALPVLGAEQVPSASPGERVGPWQLIREVGHGGMGTVWLAARGDGAYVREVALKLPRGVTGGKLVQRMAQERQIAARLVHPAIARLYDAGVDDTGRPFIAMEYVEGRRIDDWVREQKLDVAATIALYLQVVRAVAYAHGRLVIHRDLKPSNVLVDAEGRAQLLDFGIATWADGSGAAPEAPTAGGLRALTPHYAAPEQLKGGAVGVQADVYSLGVMLYELLAGTLPSRWCPVPASEATRDPTRRRALHGEVDAILAKAMAGEPGQRYASADALAEDLDRHLHGESVAARPDSTRDRLLRVLRRHRVVAGAWGLGLAALLVGGVAALVSAHRAQAALEREQQVRALVVELIGTPLVAGSQEQAVQRQAERVRARLPNDPAVQADIHGELAGAFQQLGLAHLAAEHARAQLERLEQTGAGAAARKRAGLALARALLDNEQVDAAEQKVREALALAPAANDGELDVQARVLLVRVLSRQARHAEARALMAEVTVSPTSTAPRSALARAWLEYTAANALRQSSDFKAAEPRYRRAFEHAMQSGADGVADLTQMQLDFAYELIVRNRRPEVLELMEPALARVKARGPSGAVQAASRRASLVANMALMGQLPLPSALDLLAEQRSAMLQQGQSLHPLVLSQLEFHRARLLAMRGHLAESLALMDTHVPPLLAATKWPNARYSLVNAHGRVALLSGAQPRADALTKQALTLRNEMGQARIPFAAVSHAYIAMSAIMTGRFGDAEQALDAAPEFPPERSDPVAGAVYATLLPWHRVRLRMEQGDVPAALALAAALGRGEEDATDTDFLSPMAIHAELACASGRAAMGLAQLEAMLERRVVEVDETVDPTVARLRAVAGLCQLALGRRDRARTLATQAGRAFEAQPAVSPWFKEPLLRLQRRLAG